MIKNEGFVMYCDGCGVRGPDAEYRDDVDMLAALKGWILAVVGKDYCPKCIHVMKTTCTYGGGEEP